jgi:SRSO17 transposase
MPRRPVVSDAAYGDATAFRQGLTDRGLTYALAVPASTSVHPADTAPVPPAWSGTGRPPTKTTYPDKPITAKTLVTEAGRSAGRFVVWRHGSRKTAGNPTATMRFRFLALRIRPANRNIPRSLPECWLLATLPADIRLRDLVRIAKIRWRMVEEHVVITEACAGRSLDQVMTVAARSRSAGRC